MSQLRLNYTILIMMFQQDRKISLKMGNYHIWIGNMALLKNSSIKILC